MSFDEFMIRRASERCVVLLDDGRTARLIAWKPHNRNGSRRKVIRVEYPSGRQAAVAIRHLAGIVGEDGELLPLPLMPQTPAGEDDHDRSRDLHDARSGPHGGCDLPAAGLLAASGDRRGGGADAGERALAPLHAVGGDGADRSRGDLQRSAGDHPRLPARDTVEASQGGHA